MHCPVRVSTPAARCVPWSQAGRRSRTTRTPRDQIDWDDGGGRDVRHRQPDALLTPAEVAALFRVDPKTVTRWAKSGKLTAVRTLGGHRRFLESEVRALIGVPEQSQSEDD